MSIFENYFEKPNIVSCKPKNPMVYHNVVVSITIRTIGWGWLRISAKSEPNWPGFKTFQTTKNQELTVSVPQEKELKITMFNCFGKTKHIVSPIQGSNELKEIIAPKYRIYNENLFKVSNKKKYPSINKIQKLFLYKWRNNYKFDLKKLDKTIKLLKSPLFLHKNNIKLMKLNLTDNPMNLLKTPLIYRNFNKKIRIKRIKISNRINTELN